MIVRRDTREKVNLAKDKVKEKIRELLDEIQTSLFQRALRFRQENTMRVDDYQTFREVVAEQGGFLHAHWCGDPICEDQVKQDTKATIRCIPIESEDEDGVCVRCGKPSEERIYFAKAY